jgi:tetratricopeptide (TPR) repeat protein
MGPRHADFGQVVQLDPANSAAFLRCGEAQVHLGEWDRAIADFSEAIHLDPHNAAAHNLRGEVFQRQDQHDRAIADFSEAVRLDPQDTRARNNRGDAYFRRGHFDEAIADYSLAIHLEPNSVRAYLGRSLARGEKGDYERALADFARALALDPANPFARENPEIGHRLRAAYDRALADLDRFKRDFRRAAADFAGATRLEVRPVVEPFHDRARADETLPAPCHSEPAPPQNEETVAEEVAASVSPDAIDQEYAQRQQLRQAERHYRRGWILQRQGQLDQSQLEYTAAIAIDPACVDAYLERGQLSRLANRFDEAIADFTRAIELEGGTEAYLRRANSHTEQGHFDLAFADYAEAVRIDPECAAAYTNRGLAYLKVGEFEKAVADADRALHIDPTLARALFVRGAARAKQNDHGPARDDLDSLLQLEPENTLALNQRGLVATALGHHEAAVADFTEALRLAPTFDALLFNRGSAQRLKGACAEAVADFTEFLRRRPQNAQGYYHRGLAHLDQGGHDAAIADFTHAFQLDPTLTKAYQSCLDATRAKYESQLRQSQAVVATDSEISPLPTVSDVTLEDAGKAGAGQAPPAELASAAVPEADVRKANPSKPPTPPGKLRLECPECGRAGLLDVRNLHKMFRCPGCHSWWRTGLDGTLSKVPAPGIEVEVTSDTGRSKHRIPVVPETAAARAAKADRPPEPPPKTAKPAPKLTTPREGRLSYARQWVATVAKTRSGRWAMAAGVLVLLVLVPVAFPSLFPSQLQKRGQKASQAWLARDVEQIKQYVEPSQVEYVERWLKEEPPPELAGQQPRVDVAVQRNDGQTAEVVIQIRATKDNGAPAYYVFRQHWVSRGGVWYVQPTLRVRTMRSGRFRNTC